MGEGQSKPSAARQPEGRPASARPAKSVRTAGDADAKQMDIAELQKRCVPKPLRPGYEAPAPIDPIQDLHNRCVPKGLRSQCDEAWSGLTVAAPSAAAPSEAIPVKGQPLGSYHRTESIHRGGKPADTTAQKAPQGSWVPNAQHSFTPVPRSDSMYANARQTEASGAPQHGQVVGSSPAPLASMPRSDSIYRSGRQPDGSAHGAQQPQLAGSPLVPVAQMPRSDSIYRSGRQTDASATPQAQLAGSALVPVGATARGRQLDSSLAGSALVPVSAMPPRADSLYRSRRRQADASPAPQPKPVAAHTPTVMRSESLYRSPNGDASVPVQHGSLLIRRLGEQMDEPQQSLSAVPAVGSHLPRAESLCRSPLRTSVSKEPQQNHSVAPPMPQSDALLRTQRTDHRAPTSVIYTPQKASWTPQKAPAAAATTPSTARTPAAAATTPSAAAPAAPLTTTASGATKQEALARMWDDALARTSRRQARQADAACANRPPAMRNESSSQPVKQPDFDAKVTHPSVAEVSPAPTSRLSCQPASVLRSQPTGPPSALIVKAGETRLPKTAAGAPNPWVQKSAQPQITRAASVVPPQSQLVQPMHAPAVRSSMAGSAHVPAGLQPLLTQRQMQAGLPRAGSLVAPQGPMPPKGASHAPVGQSQVVNAIQMNHAEAYLKPPIGQPLEVQATAAKVLGFKKLPASESWGSTETEPALNADHIRQIPTPTNRVNAPENEWGVNAYAD